MGWSIGYDNNWKRDVGYGVPSICDHPDCNEIIDRGLGYVCGSQPYRGEKGCGLYFCGNHLFFNKKTSCQTCDRCLYNDDVYTPKEDTEEWINHKATDPSWEDSRKEQETITQSRFQETT